MIFVVTIIFSVVCWVIEQRRTSILSVLIWVVPFRFDSLSSYYEPKAVFVDTRTVCFESREKYIFYDIWYLELQMTLPWLILMYKKIKHTKKFPFYWAVEYVDSHELFICYALYACELVCAIQFSLFSWFHDFY